MSESEKSVHDVEHLDRRYAIKLVEKIVFGMVAIILTAFILALVNTITK